MRKLNQLGLGLFSFLALSILFFGSTDLMADPSIKDIQRYKPTEQNTTYSEIYWKVYFTEPINGKTIDYDDFKLTIVKGKFGGGEQIFDIWQDDKDGYEWIVGAQDVDSKNGTIRLDFVGYVENTKGVGTSKGYKFEKGETFIYGDGGEPEGVEVSQISRFSPSQQNISAQNVTWRVYFTAPIDSKTLTTDDFTLYKTGTATGTVASIDVVNTSTYSINLTDVSGIGNLRLDFTGTVTNLDNTDSKNKFTSGELYNLLTPISITSIKRSNPATQVYKGNSVTYSVTFNRNLNASTVSSSDFLLTAVSGQITGSITNVSGINNTYNVTVSGITKDVELRLDANGTFTDTYNITNNATYNSGETYIIDFTAPKLDLVHIESNNLNIQKAIPGNTVTVNFLANETVNILSAKIAGKSVSFSGGGGLTGKANYTFNKFDVVGPTTFEFVIVDLAGNTTTFTKTTDGSFVNFYIPTPEAIIIEQPTDVIACDGSLDQYLFVVAAPSDRHYKIVYRWWKDGQPISNWIEEFGQINFDTLRYSMSGVYKAEIFAFDPNYEGTETGDGDDDGEGGGVGNGEGDYSYEEARVSPIVFSEPANLYVLQHPSFLKDIPNVLTKLTNNISLTFTANYYGEHNMENPTYWTQIQWFKGGVALENNDRYEGVNASILTINDVQSTDFADDYRVRLVGDCDTVWSNKFSIGEEPNALITVQPIDVEGCVNTTVQLTVEAEATNQGASLSYQWMVDGTNIVDEAGKFSGAMSQNLNVTLNPALNYDGTEQFTCHVWPLGFPNNGVTSGPAMITWKAAPSITTDLSATYSAKENAALTLYITAVGDNLSYKWTKDGNDLSNNNDSLTIGSLTMADAGEYVVTVTNGCGEATSTTAVLTVTQGPIITGVDVQSGYGLHQNYPNPFSVNSAISWNSERSGNAVMTLSDMLGNRVATLFDGYVNAGELKEVRLNANTLNLSTGTYYVTFTMGDKVQTKQISVVR